MGRHWEAEESMRNVIQRHLTHIQFEFTGSCVALSLLPRFTMIGRLTIRPHDFLFESTGLRSRSLIVVYKILYSISSTFLHIVNHAGFELVFTALS
jgi:hypothetical protein